MCGWFRLEDKNKTDAKKSPKGLGMVGAVGQYVSCYSKAHYQNSLTILFNYIIYMYEYIPYIYTIYMYNIYICYIIITYIHTLYITHV